ncbi:hypothetical protein FB45DRAFT_1138267 [Roridomyces roridus]|uniref:Uncharacterized protein n=1 Tax=Roridomyces roridus TaxID=1738132 RepID=A0AAD7FPS5_9AGAR|nr:hypothetical protein FB45DRAFT_1138267 [Roridomyces roridus]
MCPCASTSLFWCCGFSPTSPIALWTSDQETKWQTLDGGYGHYVHAPGPLSGARTGNARIWSCRTAEAGRCLKRRFLAEGLSWFYVLWALHLYTLRAMMQRPANSAAGPQAGGGAECHPRWGCSYRVHGTPGKNLEAMELAGANMKYVGEGKEGLERVATSIERSQMNQWINQMVREFGNGVIRCTQASGSNHESAIGERDNPTYQNFKTKTPVKKTRTLGPSQRALNREGRAICRIVSAHEWSVRQIAQIFGLSRKVITRAIDNEYSPPDVVSEDYTHLKDPEFSKQFPPGAVAPRTKFQRRKRSDSPHTTSDEDYSEDESKPSSPRVPLKRKCVGDGRPPPTSVSGAFTAKKPRHFSSSAPSRQESDSESLSPPTRSPTSAFIPPLSRRSPTKTYLL